MSLIRKTPGNAIHIQCIFSTPNCFFTSTSLINRFSPDEPTTAHYDDLVNTIDRSGDFDTLGHLLDKCMKDGCCNTVKTFNFVTKIEAFFTTIDNLCQTLARLDKGFSRKSAVDTLVSPLGKLGRIEESLCVIDTMARADSVLNAGSFNPVIKALMRKDRVENAWCVVDMRILGVSPNSKTYNCFLMKHCAAGDLATMIAVLTRMEEQKMKADSRTYDALVLGACRAGKVEGALVVLRRMEDDGVSMLLATHLYVVDMLLSLGYYD